MNENQIDLEGLELSIKNLDEALGNKQNLMQNDVDNVNFLKEKTYFLKDLINKKIDQVSDELLENAGLVKTNEKGRLFYFHNAKGRKIYYDFHETKIERREFQLKVTGVFKTTEDFIKNIVEYISSSIS